MCSTNMFGRGYTAFAMTSLDHIGDLGSIAFFWAAVHAVFQFLQWIECRMGKLENLTLQDGSCVS